MNNKNLEELLRQAADVRANAYAPYSQFKVGAAVRTKDGKIYTGANMENSSYGLSVCAERHALGAAVSAGEREFDAIAICSKGAVTPCGACRQVISDMCGDIPIYLADESGKLKETTQTKTLIPQAFGSKDL